MGFFRSLAKLFATFPLDARTASRRAVRMDAISLPFHKVMAKEKEPKGRMPFGFPQCAVAGEINLAARRKSVQIQLLRLQVKKTCKHGSCSDFSFVGGVSFCLFPRDRRKFKQDGKANAFATLTHRGRALMRPRWGSFAGPCLSAVLFSERRTEGRSRRERPGVLSFAISVRRGKEMAFLLSPSARSWARPKEKLPKVQLNLLQLFLLTLTLHFVRVRCAAYAYSLPCRKE